MHQITSVPPSPKEDRSARVRAYLIAMSIRTVAFAFGGYSLVQGWTIATWICFLAAVALPYPAVIIANNVSRKTAPPMEVVHPVRQLHSGPHRAQPEPPPTSDSTADR